MTTSTSALPEAPWIGGRVAAAPPAGHPERWLRVWVTIGILVVLVVVGFLVGIISALTSINDNLAGVIEQVGEGGALTDVRPLPDQVARANESLTGIDTALKAVPGQARTIVASLDSINSNLTNVDRLLVQTDGDLQTVLGTANSISQTLIAADDPPDGSGVQAIHRRVAVVNGVLSSAKVDTGNILSGLRAINGHLTDICRKLPTNAQGC